MFRIATACLWTLAAVLVASAPAHAQATAFRDVRLFDGTGVHERTTVVDRVLRTVRTNLLEGAILVVAVLFAFLGNLRAGLIVAAAIPVTSQSARSRRHISSKVPWAVTSSSSTSTSRFRASIQRRRPARAAS